MTYLTCAAAVYLSALAVAYVAGFASVRRHNIESASFIFVAVLLAAVFSRRTIQDPAPAAGPGRSLPLRAVTPIFLALAFLLYAPIASAGLFADDFVLLDAARQGRWTVWSELFRPAVFFVWRSLDAISRDVAVSLHVLNIALHAANATMTSVLAKKVGLAGWAAAAAGVLFLCFPASVEPVAWPAGVQDVLMTSFVLGFLLILASPSVTLPRAIGAVTLLIAACLTKETGVTGIAIGAALCVLMRAGRSVWMVVTISAIAIAVLVAVRMTFLPIPSQYAVVPSRYHLKELLVRPFATLVVPFRAAETSAAPWLALVAVLVVIVALCIAAAGWNRRSRGFHLAFFSIGFVLASIAAVNTIFFVSDDLLGSRYLYLGSVGWSLLLAGLLRDVTSRSAVIAGALGLMLAASWGAAAVAHVRVWKQAAVEREVMLRAVEKASSAECAETVVTGLPQVLNGVPMFINGFPEAMRERIPGARFRIALPGDSDQSACRLSWTGDRFITSREKF